MTAALVAGLFDDAALFPPGNATMPAAVRRHRQDREQWYAATIGAFVCPDARLSELDRLLGAARIDQFDVTLTVPDGPRALPAALGAARLARRARVVAVEVPLGAAPVTSVRDALAAADPPVAGYLEVPSARVHAGLAAEVREAGLRLKLRTGGLAAAAFPTEEHLGAALACAVAEGVPVKCTAGLHHAVRHRDPATGFEHHGFLNVLLAVHAALAGDDVRAALAEQDAAAVATAAQALEPARISAARDLFRSFGTCSIDEPLADLAALGLLEVAS